MKNPRSSGNERGSSSSGPFRRVSSGVKRTRWRRLACGSTDGREPPAVLLVSGKGEDHRGGLFLLDPEAGLRQLDDVPTAGLSASPDTPRLARLLWEQGEPTAPGTVVVYDGRATPKRWTLTELQEPHGALWDGPDLIVVSTHTDSLLWLDTSGRVAREW